MRLLDNFPKKMVWDKIEQLSRFHPGSHRGTLELLVVIFLNGEGSPQQALKGLLIESQVVPVQGHDIGWIRGKRSLYLVNNYINLNKGAVITITHLSQSAISQAFGSSLESSEYCDRMLHYAEDSLG